MSGTDSSTKRRDNLSRSLNNKPPLASVTPRHARRAVGCVGDDTKKYTTDEYESPTESTMSSSELSSFPAQNIICRHEQREKEHLMDDYDIVRTNAMENQETFETPSQQPDNGAMIEVSKITALVEEELQAQKIKHKDHLNRTVHKYKSRIESCQTEIEHLRRERDDARRELESCKRSLASQKLDAERKDRFQTEQKDQIEMLEDQKELFDGLQKERDALLEELTRNQQRQQKTKDELTALKVRVREDSQKRLSVMECLSASWDAEKKEAKQKEELLNSELQIMSKTLKAEQEYLKHKNKEFIKLEAQYRSTKAELQIMKKNNGARREDLEDDLRRERESRKRISEEHKKVLKLKNDEISMAETTIMSMRAELKSARENFALREESMAKSIEGMKQYNQNMDQHGDLNPEVNVLREENARLDGEVKELQRQVESYLANMALQQEFCDSLKSRIYKEQESEHEQIEQMHRLRKQIKKQQKEVAEKDKHIDELKQLLEDSMTNSTAIKVKAKAGSSRNVTGEKKSRRRKSKSSSHSRGGYTTS